jgi:hypothetical protein
MDIEKQQTPSGKKQWIAPELVVLDVAADTRGGYHATSPADVGNYS